MQEQQRPDHQQMTDYKHGHFYWNELLTNDLASAQDFYRTALGMSFETMVMPDGSADYYLMKAGEAVVGGLFSIAGIESFAGTPSHWLAYISVDDIDRCVETAVAAGASLMRPAFDVESVGRMAIIKQPDGAVIGWITPAANQL